MLSRTASRPRRTDWYADLWRARSARCSSDSTDHRTPAVLCPRLHSTYPRIRTPVRLTGGPWGPQRTRPPSQCRTSVTASTGNGP